MKGIGSMTNEVRARRLTGERALFMSRDLKIFDTIFDDGESPLKESRGIELTNCMFKWKYPLWYCRDIRVTDCQWFEMARAGVWYTDNMEVNRAVIEAPKNFRRCRKLILRDVDMPNAAETLWHCDGVELENVSVKGDYFGMNSQNVTAENLRLVGNYSFDGGKNITVENSRLLSKDAFWNGENILVRDSFISGEYLGWNGKNLTFENCTIESLQGMCYIENLTMRNCKLLNTTLAFEYSSVEADIVGNVDSVINPTSGTIRADSIGELIIERDKVDPGKTRIILRDNKESV